MGVNQKVVCIGGGTGISTMLRGIKAHTNQLTAVVAVSDNGGHSGWLREEMKMLPPGDIRNCLIAMADMEPLMNNILQHRFTDGPLQGHNMGNLFIAALTDLYGCFGIAVEKANEVLAVKGKVLPVTLEDINVCALHKNNQISIGEYQVVQESKLKHNPIKEIYLQPDNPKGYDKAIEAIKNADKVILGPGSLYTSILPNLLVGGIKEAIRACQGQVFYVSNLMTQPGETDYFSLSMHIKEVEKYLGENVIDYIVVNDMKIEDDILSLYEEEGSQMVEIDQEALESYDLIIEDLVEINEEKNYVRHNAGLLGQLIISRS